MHPACIRRALCVVIVFALALTCVASILLAQSIADRTPPAAVKTPLTVFFNQYQTPQMSLFIADADGRNEHPLFATPRL